MIDFIYSQPSLSSTDLDDVERRFGFTFPREFRELYMGYNGGQPKKNRFVDEKGTCIVHEFLPIKYGNPALTFEYSVENLKIEKAIFPAKLVPFAVDPGDDYYCFSLQQGEMGAIYLFHMDQYNEPERAAEYLAGSLGEFLSKLKRKGEPCSGPGDCRGTDCNDPGSQITDQ